MENLAPVVLFVYNRPIHTQKVVEALLKNEEAKYSDLFVFSDAPQNEGANENVEQVRNYIKAISGFKSITIKEQAQNQGLAKSIINGITEVINKLGKVIVLEDDIETSPYFLKFMNNALDCYVDEKKVWTVTGWQYNIDTSRLQSAFFLSYFCCWGWGTWADRWKYFDKNPDKYISMLSTKKDIRRFCFYGTTSSYSILLANKTGTLNTWATFLYAEMFANKGLCFFPAKSLVKNIGHDGSGVHCGESSVYGYDLSENEIKIDFTEIPIEENELAVRLVCGFLKKQKPSIFKRVIRKVLGEKCIKKLKTYFLKNRLS